MVIVSDKTKVLIAISLFKGLKDSLQNSLIKYDDTKFILEYIQHCINVLEDDRI